MTNAYGTEAYKLYRADDPDTSEEAAYSVDTTKLEQMVHTAIREAGPDGCIAADLLAKFPWLPYSSITARFCALERRGFIICGPDKRKGPSGRHQRVMRDSDYKVSISE